MPVRVPREVRMSDFKVIKIRPEDWAWLDQARKMQSFADFIHALIEQYRASGAA